MHNIRKGFLYLLVLSRSLQTVFLCYLAARKLKTCMSPFCLPWPYPRTWVDWLLRHLNRHLTVHRVYFNALIILEEAMQCKNKNWEILKYANKKICGIVEYEHVA